MRLGTWLAALLFVAGAPAQDRVFGMARLEDGTPWAGATVELLARPIRDDETVGVAARATATTDVRGRFHAAVVPGMGYTVWAWRAADGDDTRAYFVSDVREDVVARDPVVLARQAGEQFRRRVRVAVGAGVRAPLTVDVRAATGNVWVAVLDADADGAYELPPLPPADAQVEVWDAVGLPLRVERVASGQPSPIELRIAPPEATPVLVRDIDSEAAAPGAFVALQVGTRWVRGPDLAADGCGEIAIPPRSRAIAYATGRAPAELQRGAEPARQNGGAPWKPLRAEFEPALHAHIGPGVTLRGRILLGPEHPAVGAWVVVHEHAMHYSERNSRSVQRVRRTARTGPDGRFEVPSLLVEFPPAIDLVLAPEQMATLPEGFAGGMRPVFPVLAEIGGNGKADGVVDLGDVDLAAWAPLRLRVTAPDGAPAIGAALRLFGAPSGITVEPAAGPWIADRSGTIALPLRAGAELAVGITTRDGIGDMVTLAVDGAAGRGVTIDVPLGMRPPVYVTGRLVDRTGEPVEGFGLSLYPTQIERSDATDEGSGPVRVLRWIDPQLVQSAFREFAGTGTHRSGKDGRFRFPVPRIPARYRLSGNGVDLEVTFDGEGAPEPIQIEVAR